MLSRSEKERLSAQCIPWVRGVASRMAAGNETLADDLFSAGLADLAECMETFDPNRGCSFSTYIYKPVVGAMRDCVSAHLNSDDVMIGDIPIDQQPVDRSNVFADFLTRLSIESLLELMDRCLTKQEQMVVFAWARGETGSERVAAACSGDDDTDDDTDDADMPTEAERTYIQHVLSMDIPVDVIVEPDEDDAAESASADVDAKHVVVTKYIPAEPSVVRLSSDKPYIRQACSETIERRCFKYIARVKKSAVRDGSYLSTMYHSGPTIGVGDLEDLVRGG